MGLRLAFDLDGTITEGKYLEPPRTPEMYMSLKPYDNDTIDVLTDIMYEHEVFIITARSEPRSDRLIRAWLAAYDLPKNGATVLYNPFPGKKNPENAVWKALLIQNLDCKLVIDDSPYVYKECIPWVSTILMDNPNWIQNQNMKLQTWNYPGNRIKSWAELGEAIARIQ